MLLISEEKVRANLQRMYDRCKCHGLDFRPHAKTHQSLTVCNWMKDYGVTEISVTSLRMALAMEPAGMNRITIATPLNPEEIPALNELAGRIPLRVFITSGYTAERFVREADSNIDCFIELDAGYGRSGVPHHDEVRIARLQSILGSRHRGFYVHSGHTYDTNSVDEIGHIHQQLLAAVSEVRGYPATPTDTEFVIGDTPACATQEDFTGITALGPGNFVYFDLVQAALGSCRTEDIAIRFAAPVLEVQPSKKCVIVHAGWAQLGKDQLTDGTYGRALNIIEKNMQSIADFPPAEVVKLSQEHGTVQFSGEIPATIKPGTLLGILPVHSCAMVHGLTNMGYETTIF